MNECRQFRLTLIWTTITLFIFFSGKIYYEKVGLHWYVSIYVYIHNRVRFSIKTLKLINLFSGFPDRQSAAITKATRTAELEIYSGLPMTQPWDHFFLSFFWLAHVKQIYWFFFLISGGKKKSSSQTLQFGRDKHLLSQNLLLVIFPASSPSHLEVFWWFEEQVIFCIFTISPLQYIPLNIF